MSFIKNIGRKTLAAMAAMVPGAASIKNNEEEPIKEVAAEPTKPAPRRRLGSNRKLFLDQQAEIMLKAKLKRERRKLRANGWSSS